MEAEALKFFIACVTAAGFGIAIAAFGCGIAQGIGLALMEHYINGRTDNLHDYLIPTVGDVPPIRVHLIEDPEPLGPFGAKGSASRHWWRPRRPFSTPLPMPSAAMIWPCLRPRRRRWRALRSAWRLPAPPPRRLRGRAGTGRRRPGTRSSAAGSG